MDQLKTFINFNYESIWLNNFVLADQADNQLESTNFVESKGSGGTGEATEEVKAEADNENTMI